MKFPSIDFDNAPFKSGILFGLFVGGGLFLAVFAIWAMLMLTERLGGSAGGAGGIFGFIILPVAMFAGAPWSIWALKSGAELFLLGTAAGDLINGLLLGLVIGGIAKIRQMLRLGNAPR